MWVGRLARALGNDFSFSSIFAQRSDNRTLEGMTHAPTFNRLTTHLLCPAAAGAKYDKARVWGMPVVDMRWLSYITKMGSLPPPGRFLVSDSHAPNNETSDINGAVKMPEPMQEERTAAPHQRLPPASTPPREMTQPDADFSKQDVSFGRPNLKRRSSQDEVVPSSSPTLPPASSPSSTPRLPPSSLSERASFVLSSHSSGKAPTGGSETDDDEAAARVRSSNTPSPLKLPAEPTTDSAARALHESISNLLGKRNAGAMSMEDHVDPPSRRKRARPRYKVSQR